MESLVTRRPHDDDDQGIYNSKVQEKLNFNDQSSTSTKDNDEDELLSKSATGATLLVFGQIFTKVVTFILNQLLIRYISPRTFGISSFLEFLLSSILFFSREGERLAIQRTSNYQIDDNFDLNKKIDYDENDESLAHLKKEKFFISNTTTGTIQSVINFAYISLIIGFPLSITLIYWQYNNISLDIKHLPFFHVSILVIWSSSIIELLSEPLYAINQFNLNFKIRTIFESISVLFRCMVNFVVIFYYKKDMGLSLTKLASNQAHNYNDGLAILAFSLGQITYSILLSSLYFLNFFKENSRKKTKNNLLITKIYLNNKISSSSNFKETENYYYFDNDILNHWKSIFFQLVFKHILTEGDKFLINMLCNLEEQGIYSLISNYGSLLARLVFAPIEESLRLYLSKLISSSKNHKNLIKSINVLSLLSNFYFHLSILIIIGGVFNSSFILHLLIGEKWSKTNISEIIPVYCLYIPFLAFNGIYEAFFQSVAKNEEILNHSVYMMLFTSIFLINSYLLIETFGLSLFGLILSNILNMVLRIVYCADFGKKFYGKHNINLPDLHYNIKKVFSVSAIFSLVQWKIIGFATSFRQFFESCSLIFILVAFMVYSERELLLPPFLQLLGKLKYRK